MNAYIDVAGQHHQIHRFTAEIGRDTDTVAKLKVKITQNASMHGGFQS
jgi:hypothetical protein